VRIVPYMLMLAGIIAFASCRKKECHATLCVKNIGTDTMHFAWGNGALNDSIMPGHSKCKDAGTIEEGESSNLVDFVSDRGDFTIIVDECDKVFELD
jgi:hypothetical protein